MKAYIRILTTLAVAAGISFAAYTPAARAADVPAPANPAVSDAQTETPPSEALAALQKLVAKMRAKMETLKSQPTTVDFASELNEFDAIISANKNANPEDLAQVLGMKMQFYVQVLGEFDQGLAMLKRIQQDYPTTQAAQHADEVKGMIEDMRQMKATQQALQPGKIFPDFSVSAVDGKPLSLSQYRGKVVLVDFWATWCPPCVAEMPNVIAAYQKYHGKGFEIVGISLDQDKGKLTAFLAKNKMTWRQYFDGKGWDGELVAKYGIDSIPATFLLDAEGKIIGRDLRGPMLEEQLEKSLK